MAWSGRYTWTLYERLNPKVEDLWITIGDFLDYFRSSEIDDNERLRIVDKDIGDIDWISVEDRLFSRSGS